MLGGKTKVEKAREFESQKARKRLLLVLLKRILKNEIPKNNPHSIYPMKVSMISKKAVFSHRRALFQKRAKMSLQRRGQSGGASRALKEALQSPLAHISVIEASFKGRPKA